MVFCISFFFLFFSRFCLISLLISTLTHWLFQSVCVFCLFVCFWVCHIHVFVNFSCWFLVPYHCGWKAMRYDFNLKRVKISFVAREWYTLENVLCDLEKNVFSGVLGWKVLYIPLRFTFLKCYTDHASLIKFLSGWSIHV